MTFDMELRNLQGTFHIMRAQRSPSAMLRRGAIHFVCFGFKHRPLTRSVNAIVVDEEELRHNGRSIGVCWPQIRASSGRY
jgi:hypothetical protein